MAEEKKWYVLRVISGKEKKLKDLIELELSRSNWSDVISQILVPTEKVYKLRKGKKVISEKNLFPGYMLIEAKTNKLAGELVSLINSVNGVIHFLGKDNPFPLPKSEVNRILGKVDEMTETGGSASEPFLVGESVKITDGPFNDFIGT